MLPTANTGGSPVLTRKLETIRALVVYSFANLQGKGTDGGWSSARLSSLERAIAHRVEGLSAALRVDEILAKSESNKAQISADVLRQLNDLCQATRSILGHQQSQQSKEIAQNYEVNIRKAFAGKYSLSEMKIEVYSLLSILNKIHGASGKVVYCGLTNISRALFQEEIKAALGPERVTRQIRVSPEHKNAFIGILSYFSTVLKQKHPGIVSSVSISQTDESVVLTIFYSDGTEEEISRTLSEFGLVVTGDITPEEFLPDPLQALALRHKLEIAHLELRQARDMLSISQNQSNQTLSSLRDEVAHLRSLVHRQLDQKDALERAIVDHLNSNNPNVTTAPMLPVIERLVEALCSKDDVALKQEVDRLKHDDPTLLDRLNSFILSSSAGGMIGSASYDWLKILWPVLMK